MSSKFLLCLLFPWRSEVNNDITGTSPTSGDNQSALLPFRRRLSSSSNRDWLIGITDTAPDESKY